MSDKIYIERYWRDATPQDAIKDPPMVARFRNVAGYNWFIGPLMGIRRDNNYPWYSTNIGSFEQCQVYDAPRLRQIGQWQPLPQDAVWEDGTQLLVAIPIVGEGNWYYEYNVIEIKSDEDYFELKCNGDPWGWSWHDIDFYIQLSGAKPISMEEYLNNEGRFNE